MIISFLPCSACGELILIEKLKQIEDVNSLLCANCINKKMNEKQKETSFKENKNNDLQDKVD